MLYIAHRLLREGVTKAALGAITLDGVLRSIDQGPADTAFGRTFFKRMQRLTQGLWCVFALWISVGRA